jgi:hypothetical protein
VRTSPNLPMSDVRAEARGEGDDFIAFHEQNENNKHDTTRVENELVAAVEGFAGKSVFPSALFDSCVFRGLTGITCQLIDCRSFRVFD